MDPEFPPIPAPPPPTFAVISGVLLLPFVRPQQPPQQRGGCGGGPWGGILGGTGGPGPEGSGIGTLPQPPPYLTLSLPSPMLSVDPMEPPPAPKWNSWGGGKGLQSTMGCLTPLPPPPLKIELSSGQRGVKNSAGRNGGPTGGSEPPPTPQHLWGSVAPQGVRGGLSGGGLMGWGYLGGGGWSGE